jgi:hypothetical protein
MQYTYKVVAADNSGNVPNPSNEAVIGTITIGQPDPPTGASANTYEDYIAVSIIPLQQARETGVFTRPLNTRYRSAAIQVQRTPMWPLRGIQIMITILTDPLTATRK